MTNEEKLLGVKKQIEDLLAANEAALVPVTLISGDRVFSRVDIVPVNNTQPQTNKE